LLGEYKTLKWEIVNVAIEDNFCGNHTFTLPTFHLFSSRASLTNADDSLMARSASR